MNRPGGKTREQAGLRPEQAVDGAEALEGFTSGAAWAAREEEVRGRLLPGYFADMTVLTVDPVYAPAEDLLSARVRMTVIEGEVVYDGRASAAAAEADVTP